MISRKAGLFAPILVLSVSVASCLFADDFDRAVSSVEGSLDVAGSLRLAASSPDSAASAPAASATYALYAKLYARLMRGQTAADLEDALPGLSAHMRLSAAISRRYWTDSNLLDAGAKADILPQQVMAELGIPRRVTDGVAHAPAGMMHTYGYLFSQLQTPYGLKGKRWIEAKIDERLGLPAGTFSPTPPAGEFASNVTAAVYRLIGVTGAPPSAAALEPSATPLGRLDEDVTWETPEGRRVSASVRTHLFEMRSVPGAAEDGEPLLIYEVVRGGRHLIVTAFPAGGGTAGQVASSKPADDDAFKPLYNLYVDPRWRVVARHSSGFLPGRR